MLLIGLFGFIYTALTYEIGIASNAITFASLCIQLLVKYLCVRDIESLVEIANVLLNTFKYNSGNKSKIHLFAHYNRLNIIIIHTIVAIYTITTLAYLLFPILIYFQKGIVIAPFPAHFPGIDENSTPVFVLIVFYNLLLSGLLLCFTIAFELLIVIVFVNMLMLADNFHIDLLVVNESATESLGIKMISLIRGQQEISR